MTAKIELPSRPAAARGRLGVADVAQFEPSEVSGAFFWGLWTIPPAPIAFVRNDEGHQIRKSYRIL